MVINISTNMHCSTFSGSFIRLIVLSSWQLLMWTKSVIFMCILLHAVHRNDDDDEWVVLLWYVFYLGSLKVTSAVWIITTYYDCNWRIIQFSWQFSNKFSQEFRKVISRLKICRNLRNFLLLLWERFKFVIIKVI